MEDEHYTYCDGLCYDCEKFTWCELSPGNENTEDISYIDKTKTHKHEKY